MFSLKVHASSQLDEESKVYLSEHKQIPVATKGEVCLLKGGCEDCTNAAVNGHLEVLKWLHEKGAPWNENACYYAAFNGHLETFKWLLVNGCHCSESTKGIMKAKWPSEEW